PIVSPVRRPSSSQYRSGEPPTTGAAFPGRPGPVQAPPPVTVTNALPCLVPVCTTTALCANPLTCEKPVVGPAGPMKVSEKNQASWVAFSRIAETPSPPAQSAQLD